MNDQYQPTISKTSVKINQTGCSITVAFLAEECNIIFGKRMQIGTMGIMVTFHFTQLSLAVDVEGHSLLSCRCLPGRRGWSPSGYTPPLSTSFCFSWLLVKSGDVTGWLNGSRKHQVKRKKKKSGKIAKNWQRWLRVPNRLFPSIPGTWNHGNYKRALKNG